MKKILITGITGQDGLFLTEKYLNENENHFVYGISRSNDLNLFYKKLNSLNVKSVENLKILNIDLNNRNQVFDLLKK
jgi:GDP-D-mannose dehydratase